MSDDSSKLIDIQQDSISWHEHRNNYINASEVAAIMGLNPFESVKLLFKRKLFQEKIEVNEAMRRGRRLEPEARFFFNSVRQMNFVPAVFVKQFMSASLDGWNSESRSILEIKCPISCDTASWKEFFLNDKIPKFYYAQIQAQLYCSNADKAFFLVYYTYQHSKVIEVYRDLEFINNMYNKCFNFYKLFNEAKQILKKLSDLKKIKESLKL
ncbi:MAG: YqaJ viral recombinase family protein [Candidatus Phytoplasma australasiaticum]|uniref:YqaJ viral recombinase family protein n=2 Tax=16SrII (Peanut WB group) TaxID=85621 RepID=A0A9K3WRG0_9MOLU|nr:MULTISPECIES: YqaJ viral recombinase family protein [Phytoplasma]MCG3566538.1 YqaJ viral recombinase family protein [Sesame phyllody phytoplasma]MDO8030934.1 YqaJ viral recombinase family protein [Candidatus Phytoplasma australasiaticum]MDO8031411.1 YqaJ viral recombinase family protein [Candidatus Phytoplasma australasiaticum]MDO8046452.1 YqaJ viral recombinase family protein [Candidatus Phytoplasma australasiaticum]MDO8053009.1 YqaJ viral recombinase family protein [Candidatus Phytoplasma